MQPSDFQEPQPLLMPGLEMKPAVTVKIGSMGEWTMTKERMQKALAYKEIPLKTYIKWAILYEYGEMSEAKIDIDLIIQNWSFEAKNQKGKHSEHWLTTGDVLGAIAALEKEESFVILDPPPIQLKLLAD